MMMTVGELREILADVPDSATVFVGWFEATDSPEERLEVQGAHGLTTPDGYVVLEVEKGD